VKKPAKSKSKPVKPAAEPRKKSAPASSGNGAGHKEPVEVIESNEQPPPSSDEAATPPPSNLSVRAALIKARHDHMKKEIASIRQDLESDTSEE
jgi:hypothetical protein